MQIQWRKGNERKVVIGAKACFVGKLVDPNEMGGYMVKMKDKYLRKAEEN